jgi:hypothetical protein
MHSAYLCEADLTVCEIGSTIANVITLALKMPGAFALPTLVFQMWTIFAPMEFSTAEAWRRRIILHRWLGWLVLLKWWVLAALHTFLLWLLCGVQMDVFVGENLTVGLCGEKVHTVGKNVVETYLITILAKFLQDSSAQRFVGRRFQRGD